jgi:S1-C subfamily serine protease
VDERVARGLGLDLPRGALVTRVYPGSAAAEAGLQPGDVVLAANGQRIDGADALRNFQGLQPVDSAVALEVLRDGKPQTLNARLRALPRDGASFDARLAGVTLSDLPEAYRRQYPNARGVLVEKVAPDSRAWRNNLREGDLIVAANSGEFRDLAGFRDTLADGPQQLVLQVSRRGRIGNLMME